VSELAKIGVSAKESDTGIDIEGVGGSDEQAVAPLRAHIARAHAGVLGGNAIVRCHDDHRIAMSLSIVGVRVGRVVLDEKRCVDKTYPEFWEDTERVLGITYTAPDEAIMHAYEHGSTGNAEEGAAAGGSSNAAPLLSDDGEDGFAQLSSGPSLVLIGMRASGKVGTHARTTHTRM